MRSLVSAAAALTVIVAVTAGVAGCMRDTAPDSHDAAPVPGSQNVWQAGDITASTGSPSASGGGLAAYVFEAQGTQHVIYSSVGDSHVHELWWNVNGWHTADLTQVAGAAPATGPITGYAFAAENTQHVVYLGVDDRIHELWFDRIGWHAGDLTAVTGAPPITPGAALTGYAFESQHTQHVLYTSAPDNHLRELSFGAAGWHADDLTVAAGAPPTAAGAALTGYAFESQHTQHVMYTSAPDNHIRELWSDVTGWHADDLTTDTGSAPVGAAGTVVGYPFEKQRTQHVIYTAAGGRLHELWCEGTTWHATDLTTVTGAPPAQAVTAYVLEAQGTEHVVYKGFDNRLYELWWNNGWHLGDLTAATGAPAPGVVGPLGYAFEVQDTQHVIYVSADDRHIRELWWGPKVTHPPDAPRTGVAQASKSIARIAPAPP